MKLKVVDYIGKYFNEPPEDTWEQILKRPFIDDVYLKNIVHEILTDVKINGDDAVKKYTIRFDGISLNNFIVTEEEFAEAENLIDHELKLAILAANVARVKSNIKSINIKEYYIA